MASDNDPIFGFADSGQKPFNQGVFVHPTHMVWPCWMPVPLVTAWGVEPVDRRTKTEMEISGIYRVEFDTDETRCQCELILDSDAAAWFEAFEQGVLKQGSTWFEMPLWVAGEISDHVVRMRERSKGGGKIGMCHTRYTLSLEVAERNLFCPQYAEAMLYYSPTEIRYYSKYFNNTINNVMPGITNIPAGVWS